MQKVANLKHKKVTVMGLGLSGGGLGVAKWLLMQGARVTVTDLRSAKHLAPSIKELDRVGIAYNKVLGRHRFCDFTGADLIIKNPGVSTNSPYLRKARTARVPIDTAIGLFIDRFPGKIIGITGTKSLWEETTQGRSAEEEANPADAPPSQQSRDATGQAGNLLDLSG